MKIRLVYCLSEERLINKDKVPEVSIPAEKYGYLKTAVEEAEEQELK